jgi:hypothetical protein
VELSGGVTDAPWIPLHGTSFWRVLWAGPGAPVGQRFLIGFIVFELVVQLAVRRLGGGTGANPGGSPDEYWGWVAGLAALVLALVVLILFVFVLRARNPVPEVNFALGRLRVGRQEVAFDAITDATYLAVQARGKTDWYLRVGPRFGPAAIVCVRSSRVPVIDAGERETLAEVIRRSAVEVPAVRPDPYDPKGRFSWLEHPAHLSRDEAIEYLLHTPESGQPVRTPPPKKSIWRD